MKRILPNARNLMILLIGLALTVWVVIAFAQGDPPSEPAKSKDILTENDLATMDISTIKDRLKPVSFTHKSHFENVGDCKSCHHYSPADSAGLYPSCSSCHWKPGDEKTRAKGLPSLKDAYHIQCLECHKDVGEEYLNCTICHSDGPSAMLLDKIPGKYAPLDMKHDLHVNKTEKCAACHHHPEYGTGKQAIRSCETCHKVTEVATTADALPGLKSAYHQQCMGCHKEKQQGPMKCAECHTAKEAPAKQ